MKLTTRGSRLVAFLAAFALAACSLAPRAEAPAAPTAPAAAHPALWKLADRDTTIYLFGTFHLLPQGMAWRSRKLEDAMGKSGELVMELGDPGDPAAAAQVMASLGFSPGLPPLLERVPEARREELRQMIAESGLPAPLLDRLETWAAAFSLLSVTFKRFGVSADAGVEPSLIQSYKQSGKPIRGLETIAEQLGIFDGLSEDAQRAFLVGMLDDPAGMKEKFALMLKAWSEGDVDGIAATFNDDVSMSSELLDLLLKKRNARWADWLAHRMEQPGTIFVAVGAGHLAGPDSVQAMLAAKGLKTKRVQ
jgi:uncharacterized protein YbaP (TraB family)